MKDKLKELRKALEKSIDFFDKQEIYGVVSYLEAIYDCLDGAEEELEAYLDEQEGE